MSEHYKIIRRTREAVRELKSQGWTQTKIANHIDVSSAMIGDLLEIDEVAMNLRQPTIDKFQKFLDSYNVAKQYLKDKESLPPGPAPPVKTEPLTPEVTQDMLDSLSGLAAKFAKKGFRLDCALTMIHKLK